MKATSKEKDHQYKNSIFENIDLAELHKNLLSDIRNYFDRVIEGSSYDLSFLNQENNHEKQLLNFNRVRLLLSDDIINRIDALAIISSRRKGLPICEEIANNITSAWAQRILQQQDCAYEISFAAAIVIDALSRERNLDERGLITRVPVKRGKPLNEIKRRALISMTIICKMYERKKGNRGSISFTLSEIRKIERLNIDDIKIVMKSHCESSNYDWLEEINKTGEDTLSKAWELFSSPADILDIYEYIAPSNDRKECIGLLNDEKELSKKINEILKSIDKHYIMSVVNSIPINFPI